MIDDPAEEACDLGWSIAMLQRGYAAIVEPVFADLPRGARGYQLLHTVIHKRIRSQIALADYLGVDRTVMPYLVDDLEAAGLVERRDDPSDRRIRTVAATSAGRSRYTVLRAEVEAAELTLLGALSEPSREELVGGLGAVARTARAFVRSPRPRE